MPKKKYESVAVPKTFGAASRASVKIENNFYTFEASMTKEIPAGAKNLDMDREWEILWDELNEEVDNQILETEKIYKSVKAE